LLLQLYNATLTRIIRLSKITARQFFGRCTRCRRSLRGAGHHVDAARKHRIAHFDIDTSLVFLHSLVSRARPLFLIPLSGDDRNSRIVQSRWKQIDGDSRGANLAARRRQRACVTLRRQAGLLRRLKFGCEAERTAMLHRLECVPMPGPPRPAPCRSRTHTAIDQSHREALIAAI
jgi:hypothetical protein